MSDVLKSKEFKALLSVFDGNEAAAQRAWNKAHPDNQIADEDEPAQKDPKALRKLLKAGFSREAALAALAEVAETPDVEDAPAGPLTSREKSEVQVAQRGLVYVSGRVYTDQALIEAQVRVLKSGKPEIVDRPGNFRTKAVAVFRSDDDASVALQNLGAQN